MNKIYVYCLGVLCYLQSQACFALEKFEILPDLPEPLMYAVQPAAEAATVTTTTANSTMLGSQTIGHEPNMLSVIMSLAFVVLLIYATGIIYTKMNGAGFKTFRKQQGDLSKSQVSVISTTQLGSNKTLHVVELDGKRMLIGASSSAIQLIKDLGSVSQEDFDGEYSHIEIPNIKIPKIEIPKIEIPSINFAKMATKTHKKFVEDETEDTLEQTEDVVVKSEAVRETIEEENPDVIIDSLFPQQENFEEDLKESSSDEHKVDPADFALYKKYLS